MEFEPLSEDVKWECERVAAAVGVAQWKQRNLRKEFELLFEAAAELFRVMWWISTLPLGPVCLLALEVPPPRGEDGTATWMTSYKPNLPYEIREVGQATREPMARGLYCLGIENESTLAQLPALSTHEKLELRLAMPREFWPQKWLDEEAK